MWFSFSLSPSAGCGPPSPPVNGSVGEWTSSRVGAQVNYSCDTDLVLVGERVAYCSLPQLQWLPSSDDVLCVQLPGMYVLDGLGEDVCTALHSHSYSSSDNTATNATLPPSKCSGYLLILWLFLLKPDNCGSVEKSSLSTAEAVVHCSCSVCSVYLHCWTATWCSTDSMSWPLS